MTGNTKIQWADHSASPWHGCSEIHLGCDRCYAREMAKRNPDVLGVWGNNGTRVKSKSFSKNCRRWNARAKKRGVIKSVFPSICDPFEDRSELEPWRREMFGVIDECRNLVFFLLTKRPENIRRMWPKMDNQGNGWFKPNVHLLTSVSDQTTADAMIPELHKCRDLVPVLGVSAEPLLGPLLLILAGAVGIDRSTETVYPNIDWLICGGESGHNARKCDLEWIRSIRDQCEAADLPLFIKQLGSNTVDHLPPTSPVSSASWLARIKDKKAGDWDEWAEEFRIRQFPKAHHETDIQDKQQAVGNAEVRQQYMRDNAGRCELFQRFPGVFPKSDACDPHHIFGGHGGRWDLPASLIAISRPAHEFVQTTNIIIGRLLCLYVKMLKRELNRAWETDERFWEIDVAVLGKSITERESARPVLSWLNGDETQSVCRDHGTQVETLRVDLCDWIEHQI